MVVAATDFSPAGDAAIAKAYGLAGRSGMVYLVHVLTPRSRSSALAPHDIFSVSSELADLRRATEEKLRARVPVRSMLDEKRTELRVLESAETAEAIAQAAERLGADVICLGVGERNDLAKAFMGSVAQGVVKNSERPVLLVRAPRK